MTRLCSFLFLGCLLLVLSTSAQHTPGDDTEGGEEEKKRLSVLLLASSFIGHHFPLIALGEELVSRGHRVAVLGPLIEGSSVLSNLSQSVGIEFINAGFVSKKILAFLSRMGKNVNLFKLLYRGQQARNEEEDENKFDFLVMLRKGVDRLNPQEWDYVVADNAAVSIMYYIMQKWKTDKVMLNLSPLGFAFGAPPPWPSPNMLSGLKENMTFKDRLVNFMYGFILTMFMPLLNRLLEGDVHLGINYMENLGLLHPLLINTVLGFDYPKTRPPLAHYTGPMLMHSYPPLKPELLEWLQGKQKRSVVYISMGSGAELTPELGRSILHGVITQYNYSVVWALRESNRDILKGMIINQERVFLADWVSQVTLLQHETITMAILHCGLGGVQEALYNKVPVICVPYGYDQFDAALRLDDQGFGVRILPTEVTQETVSNAVGRVGSGIFQNKVNKISILLKKAGGARMAADLVELYADVGHEHGIPAFVKYKWNWVQYYNVDVRALLLLVAGIMMWAYVKCLICCCRRCCQKLSFKSKKD